MLNKTVPGRHILKDLRDFTDFLQLTIQPAISLNRIRKQVKIVAKQEFEENFPWASSLDS